MTSEEMMRLQGNNPTRIGRHAQTVSKTTWNQSIGNGISVPILERVLERLAREYTAANKEALFAELRGFLLGQPGSRTYADAGKTLGISEGAARVASHRMRERYREIFRDEIAFTVGHPSEIDREIEYLKKVLSS